MNDVPAPGRAWTVVHIEDEPALLEQVKSYLEGETFDFGQLTVVAAPRFEDALSLLRERRVDLVILDILRGSTEAADRAGLEVLEKWREVGFAPVVIYSALPEGLADVASPFVRIVTKEHGGLDRLAGEIRELFRLKIPQVHRVIVEHLDSALRTYMWGFVVSEWARFGALIEQPDFVRLLIRRLAMSFTRGIEPLINEVYPPYTAAAPAAETIHPVEYYLKPPIGPDPQLGDLRRLNRQGQDGLWALLWPSCDLVDRGGACKVEKALCARAQPIAETEEFAAWSRAAADGRAGAEKKLRKLLANNRSSGQADRWHFLPAAWDIPALVVDFGDLEHVPVRELREATCVATIASPFAEALAMRFIRYIGRLGTPDLDLDIVISSLLPPPAGGPGPT